MSDGLYKYKATVKKVYDGDTLTVEVDLGFTLKMELKLRLVGINTPEIKCSDPREKKLGKEVRDYLRELILNKKIYVDSKKKGKYGRYLADIYLGDLHINQHLVDKGYAREYYGGRRKPWFD